MMSMASQLKQLRKDNPRNPTITKEGQKDSRTMTTLSTIISNSSITLAQMAMIPTIIITISSQVLNILTLIMLISKLILSPIQSSNLPIQMDSPLLMILMPMPEATINHITIKHTISSIIRDKIMLKASILLRITTTTRVTIKAKAMTRMLPQVAMAMSSQTKGKHLQALLTRTQESRTNDLAILQVRYKSDKIPSFNIY